MPKLKKHSETNPKLAAFENADVSIESYEIASEDCSLSINLVKPRKMKLSQRLKVLQDASSAQSEKKTQKQVKQQKKDSSPIKDDHEIENYFSKFTDDDIDSCSGAPQHNKKKAKKNEIRIKNKMFSSFQFEQSTEDKQQVPKQLQLQVIKKDRRQSGCLLQKFDQKATIFKKKLEYKELNKDHRYKKDIQAKLKSIEQAEYVNITVQVPKVFGGKDAHLEAAIFLKNKKELSSTQERLDNSRKSDAQEESVILKDRKQYYEVLGKQMKLKKAETMTENVLKECFKKSKLQDLDFIPDLNFNYSTKQSQQQEASQVPKAKMSQNVKKIGSLQDSNLSRQSLRFQREKKKLQQKSSLNQQPEKNQTQKLHKQTLQSEKDIKIQKLGAQQINQEDKLIKPQSPSQINQNPNPRKEKKGKAQKKPLNKKNFRYSKYIEVEAQISSDQEQGGPKHRDDDQSDDQDTNVSSLIDDDAQYDSNDRHLVHRKFLQDMIEQQEKNYNQIKQKMQKKYLEEEENFRKRMQQAATRNKKKQDQQNDRFLEQKIETNNESDPKSNSNHSSSILKNEQKLKQLEQRLQIKKDIKEHHIDKPQFGNKIIKLKEIEESFLEKKNNALKKTNRNGLQSMVVKKREKAFSKK